MQAGFDAIKSALSGSARSVVQVDAWYDGDLVEKDLNVLSGSLTFDSTRAIAASLETSIGSPDGTLTPTGYADPLACYGSELHVRGALLTSGATKWFSLGWYRIDDYAATESWQNYPLPNGDARWVQRGVTVANTLSDRMSAIDDAQFLIPTQPLHLESVISEIRRLARGIVPLEKMTGIADKPIPPSFAYDTSRTTTITNLAALVGCSARMSPSGALGLYPLVPGTTPDWEVTVGADGVTAPLLAWARSGSRAGLYNAVVSTGQASDGSPTQGQAIETSGPLRWNGPFGRVPVAHTTATLTSNDLCNADAQSQLDTLAMQRTVVVPVTLPWNPAAELGDVLAMTLPDRVITGSLQTIGMPITPGVMTAGVQIPRDSLWGLAAAA
ncbi:hypothetical protein [Jatrophihabitans sp.]|uniref:hypothetical protein n=1 Tax=Jatrophihabitans sp. TaxID=1932789 RepID=UPI0030C71E85|nr:69, gp69 [Jatrophihabitans sp.]